MTHTPWKIAGHEVGTCNCAWGCHQGHGISQLAIDERPTADERHAITKITSGKEISAPIHFEFDQERRVAILGVPGLGEFRAEPTRNPVTGEQDWGRIDLPNGFEYTLAELANCVENREIVGTKRIANTNCYAQFRAIDWTNA